MQWIYLNHSFITIGDSLSELLCILSHNNIKQFTKSTANALFQYLLEIDSDKNYLGTIDPLRGPGHTLSTTAI